MSSGARAIGLGERTFAGVVHSKDSLFGRELSRGPRREANDRYMAELTASGVLATEMEASILFVMAAVASATKPVSLAGDARMVPVQAAAILAVYGEPGSAETGMADAGAIAVAVAGVRSWARSDRSSREK